MWASHLWSRQQTPPRLVVHLRSVQPAFSPSNIVVLHELKPLLINQNAKWQSVEMPWSLVNAYPETNTCLQHLVAFRTRMVRNQWKISTTVELSLSITTPPISTWTTKSLYELVKLSKANTSSNVLPPYMELKLGDIVPITSLLIRQNFATISSYKTKNSISVAQEHTFRMEWLNVLFKL